ncbi:MAG: hypothetical protein C5B51_27440 [Terriglobia bacterium]|nr:MAG: hypothetical protein C5B51_27440 [Terriglobia bacterium]
MPRLARTLLLFAALLAVLGFGISRSGVAEPFSDPLSLIRSQDESAYANGALRMATAGGWLTPRFMGRYLLIKPPLLVWLAGFSMKIGGISRFALRLPVLVAGALATLLLIVWSAKAHSWWTAAATGLLLVANPLWHTFSRLCYTDMLLAAAIIAALFTLWRDPELSRRESILAFGVSVAAGVMAKNIAGLLPVAILAIFYLLVRLRPTAALAKALAVVAVLAGPWHIYQAIAHGRWFWTDYVKIQLLGFGLNPPAQPVAEGAIQFYGKRLLFTDPFLSALVLLALPFVLHAAKERKHEAALLLSWMLVTAAAVLAFQYRNLPYLLQLIPPLSLAATGFGPVASRKGGRLAVPVLAAVFCAKAIAGTPAWAISYGAAPPLPAAAALRWYAGLSRPNELLAVNTDDEFSASVMPLPKVRYVFVDPQGMTLRYAPHYGYLGITVSASQFDELERWELLFQRHLQEWGLDSVEPVATVVVANSAAEVVHMISTHPQSDFYLPEDFLGQLPDTVNATHSISPFAGRRFFLLARDSRYSARPTGKLLLLE